MGWNTVVIVNNDAWGEIERDKQFGHKIVRAIQELHSASRRINSGNCANAAHVVTTHDRAYPQVIISGNGPGELLDLQLAPGVTGIEALIVALEARGYKIERPKEEQ